MWIATKPPTKVEIDYWMVIDGIVLVTHGFTLSEYTTGRAIAQTDTELNDILALAFAQEQVALHGVEKIRRHIARHRRLNYGLPSDFDNDGNSRFA